jgi:inhibitor of KinA sporulation pathway (predicted exonuclease)
MQMARRLDKIIVIDVEPRPFYVKPASTAVTPFCTGLTGITQSDVDEKGMPFADACRAVVEACKPRQRVWASYGDYDWTVMEKCRK